MSGVKGLPEGLFLDTGKHSTPSDGLCLMEAVAFVAGEAHTDHPVCVSPVLGAYGRQLNDVLPSERRQRLVPLIPRLVGTAGDGLDERRGFMALDWLARVYLPAFLDLVPSLVVYADGLRVHPEVVDMAGAVSVGRLCQPARAAALDAAWVAAWVAVRDAALDAALDAARAAWVAARDAARDAALDAAGAAWDAARDDAAWVAARAVRVAARDAALDAALDAGTAARVAAYDDLSLVAARSQASAITLFERMINPVEVTR